MPIDATKEAKDPAEKLKDLHAWLLNNKVPESNRNNRPITPTTAWKALPESKGAKKEVAEFQEWLKEIQSAQKMSSPIF